MLPKHLMYTSHHQWCAQEGNALVLGATQYALKPLGGIACVELPEETDDILMEVSYGQIEGLRRILRLYSPADGVVLSVNGRVVNNPDLLVKDPYEQGWLIRLGPDAPFRDAGLFSAEDYATFVRSGG